MKEYIKELLINRGYKFVYDKYGCDVYKDEAGDKFYMDDIEFVSSCSKEVISISSLEGLSIRQITNIVDRLLSGKTIYQNVLDQLNLLEVKYEKG